MYKIHLNDNMVLALLLALIWGTTFSIVKVSGNYEAVLFWRNIISALLILVTVIIFYRSRASFDLICLGYGVIGGVFNLIFIYTLFKALSYMPSYVVSALLYTYPIITLIILAILKYERLRAYSFLGVLLSFTGAAILYVGSEAFIVSFEGFILSFIASLAFSITSIASRLSGKIIEYTLIQLLVTALLTIPIFNPGNPLNYNMNTIIASIHQGVGAGFIAYLTWFTLLSRSATLASSLVYMVPIVAYIAAIPVANEIFTLPDIIGLILILLGIYIARKAETRRLQL
ncbi:MAG: DMT family transporter [Acidilobaceae archaeon]